MSGLSRRQVLGAAGAALVAAPAGLWWASHGQEPEHVRSARSPQRAPEPSPTATPRLPARTGILRSADLLVFSRTPLRHAAVARVRRAKGVSDVLQITMSQVSVEDQLLMLASVDPASYRDFTPITSADATVVWDRVAGGEIAVDPSLRRTLPADGRIRLGASRSAPLAHIGAFAPQITDAIHLVGNESWASKLKMQPGNGLLISTGSASPDRVVKAVEHIVGRGVSVQRLDIVAQLGLDPHAVHTASVVGSVADAVGQYSYGIRGESVVPDPRWVSSHIATESVPILGNVTGNRLLFPQLRAALEEVVDRGLAHTILRDEYGGCYNPRYIAGTRVLSNHAFGLAIDLNVAQNQRGTKGRMNRTVVDIFRHWGFTWGGTWSYTDPMHFEINRLVTPT